MFKFILAIAVVFLTTTTWANVAKYDNYQVYRIIPQTEEQLAQLRMLENQGLDFDFWKGVSVKNAPVDIMVPPHKLAHFREIMNTFQLEAKPYIDNVQKLIDETTTNTKSNSKGFGWTNYHSGAEINQWMQTLANTYDNAELVVGGKSYEGRDIMGVKVSFKKGNKAVFLEAGIHAREWIAPATVTYILNELLTSQDPAVRAIAENNDWYIFPSVNPDGYEYTRTTDRLWRKTRQPDRNMPLCIGADPNRNWGFHWMDGGASSYPCSDTYGGSAAFSEPETKSLSQYITKIQKEQGLLAYVGFHSYSQFLLIPYGHTSAHLDNYEEEMEIGRKAAASLKKLYGTSYKVGTVVDVIYVASGGSMDWVKGTYKTPITYTYELRDTGRHGFVLPVDQIIPTGQETMASIVTMIQEANDRGL